jgi:DNA-binding MarR family transcriptional regulator
MGKPISLYQQHWSDKRYLKVLTCRKACELSHAERLVLSFLVYKARDKVCVGTKSITKALGLDRRTVWAATRKLVELRLATKTGPGYQALDPLVVRPDWFADPHEAKDWWVRPRTYRHYLLTNTARRSRGNREGRLTERDNSVLWMLYSLGNGGCEIVGQRVAGLAILLGCSPHTVRDALARLSNAGLVMKRSDGFTLLAPEQAVHSWWRDRPKKEQASVVPITEAGAPLAWIESLVADRFPSDSDDDRDTLARMVEKCSQQMLAGRVKPAETKKYWQNVLQMILDADKAFDFCSLDWDAIWKDAHRIHATNGKHAGSCIHLLTANTQTRLTMPRIDLSLFG